MSSRSALALQQLGAVGAQLARGADKAIERLPRDAQLVAKVSNLGVALGHGRLREAQLGRRHPVRPATIATTGAGRRQPGDRSLADQLTLELGQCRENTEHQPTAGGCRVDVGTLTGEHAEADAALHQVVDGID